jgi:hypothetical protein
MTEPELHRDPEAAADMAVNAVIEYLRGCGIQGEENKRQWISRVFERVIAKELSH